MPEKQAPIHAPRLAVERAIDELRRQQGVTLTGMEMPAGYYPVEFLSAAHDPAWSAAGSLLLTAPRARLLGLGDRPVLLPVQGMTLPQLHALADPTLPQPPLPAAAPAPATPLDGMALKLAKYASLLPALLRLPQPPAHWLTLAAAQLEQYIAQPEMEVLETAAAALPLADAEQARIISFRSAQAAAVHLALIIGAPDAAAAPLTRIHSSCVTGDILGSLRCDCGDQLRLAVQQISAAGGGLLIYLHQEGRGIGITNKLRAYRLQEQGMDTFDANLALGFEEDERNFALAASILKKLGFPAIRMLTNNPQKMAALQAAGITVTERVPLVVATGRHNHSYLEAKQKRTGHIL